MSHKEESDSHMEIAMEPVGPTIALINKATVDLDLDLEEFVAALQKYIDKCASPAWGISATVTLVQEASPEQWPIYLFDTVESAEQSGLLDKLHQSQPIEVVIVKSVLDKGQKLSVFISHICLEMLVNPTLLDQSVGKYDNCFQMFEICDPVHGLEEEVDGIALADFVYPAYFDRSKEPWSEKFDHLDMLHNPFAISPGAFAIVNTVGTDESESHHLAVHFGDEPAVKEYYKHKCHLHRHQRLLEKVESHANRLHTAKLVDKTAAQ